jgi:peptidoglycan-associated lipoprotein
MKRHLFVVLLLAAVLGAACGGKKRPPVLANPGDAGSSSADRSGSSRDTQPVDGGPDVSALRDEGASGTDFALSDASGEGGPLADIHFELDRATLTEEARATIEKHALWLQSHREAKVTIEGHCDERGTTEYNLALGDRRARAARDYIVSLGIPANRLRTISYGKERPVDPGHNEAAWAQNRRAEFVFIAE